MKHLQLKSFLLYRLPFGSENDLARHRKSACAANVVPPVTNSDALPTPRREVNNVASEKNSLQPAIQTLKIVCNFCKRYYASKDSFDRHTAEKAHLQTPTPKYSNVPINSQVHTFVCSLCRTMTKTVLDMRIHWKKIHSPIREIFTCKTCKEEPIGDAANFTWEHFQQHCSIRHKTECVFCLVYYAAATHVCETCKTAFANERSLGDHLRIHEKSIQEPALVRQTVAQVTPRVIVSDTVQPDGGRQILQTAAPIKTSVIMSNNSAPLNTPVINNVETIDVDSRSNSPVVAVEQPQQIVLPLTKPAKTSTPEKATFMTSINSDYENLLKPAEPEKPSPEPFEVVLVNDESSSTSSPQMVQASSDTDSAKEVESNNQANVNVNDKIDNSNQPVAAEPVKPLLRVRSIAELQHVKVSDDGEQTNPPHNATPVQVINPMQNLQAPVNDEPMHQQQQLQQQAQSYNWYVSFIYLQILQLLYYV